MEYPKTENLFNRDPETHKTPAALGFRNDAVPQIGRWLVTEKIDGMNMRVVYYPFGVNDSISEPVLNIYGRTDRANIPGDLMALMQSAFTVESLNAAFDIPQGLVPAEWNPVDEQENDDAYDFLYSKTEDGYAWQYKVVLFGEGFGPGIQSGAHYGDSKQFALFDVVVGDHWLRWSDVEDVARKLNVPTVPVLAPSATLDYVQTLVKVSASTLLGDGHPKVEGVIARTDPYLFDSRGKRVMFKAKVKDLV